MFTGRNSYARYSLKYFLLLGLAWQMMMAGEANAEPRRFQVFLADPTAQWVGPENRAARLKPNPADVDKYYFDYTRNGENGTERIDSFKEWWEEVSYGKVTIEGTLGSQNQHTFGWFEINWPVTPQNSDGKTPADFIPLVTESDQNRSARYGRGERFYDGYSMFTIDYTNGFRPPDFSVLRTVPQTPGSEGVSGDGVWTPGERFMDVPSGGSQGQYDAAFEFYSLLDVQNGDNEPNCLCNHPANDLDELRMFSNVPYVLQDAQGNVYMGSGTLSDCEEDTAELLTPSCPDGETTTKTECEDAGCFYEPSGGCPQDQASCSTTDGCVWDGTACILAPKCDPPDCDDYPSGCAVRGCDSSDFYKTIADSDDEPKRPESHEDYLHFRDKMALFTEPELPGEFRPENIYQAVPDDYVMANYPGDVESLLKRSGKRNANPYLEEGLYRNSQRRLGTGNNFYDPPEAWDPAAGGFEFIAGQAPFNFPSASEEDSPIKLRNLEYDGAITSGKTTPEPSWYKDFWKMRYGSQSTPPPWQLEIPELVFFEPTDETADDELIIQLNYKPNKGGRAGYGSAGLQHRVYNGFFVPPQGSSEPVQSHAFAYTFGDADDFCSNFGVTTSDCEDNGCVIAADCPSLVDVTSCLSHPMCGWEDEVGCYQDNLSFCPNLGMDDCEGLDSYCEWVTINYDLDGDDTTSRSEKISECRTKQTLTDVVCRAGLGYGNGLYLDSDKGPIYPSKDMNRCGEKEHDDLPSSLYHARFVTEPNPNTNDPEFLRTVMLDYGGDKTIGEVTSADPWDVGLARQNYGDDRTREPFSIAPGEDDIILPAGPLAGGDVFFLDGVPPGREPGPYERAVGIHGSGAWDGGNILTLEFLTWQRMRDYGRTRPLDMKRDNNIVGYLAGGEAGFSSRCVGTCDEYALDPSVDAQYIKQNPGFADFDLDGLLDLGEGVDFGRYDDDGNYYGVENYAIDSNSGSLNDGVLGRYPYNRERMIEDVIEVRDPRDNLGGQFDRMEYIPPSQISKLSGIVLLPGGMGGDDEGGEGGTFADAYTAEEFSSGVGVFSTPAAGYSNSPGTWSSSERRTVGMPILNLMKGTYDGEEPCPQGADCRLIPTPGRLAGEHIPGVSNSGAHAGVNSMAILLDRGTPNNAESAHEGKYKATFALHEYGHIWERFVDLYDYDELTGSGDDQENVEAPVGGWDIMAGDKTIGKSLLPQVHTIPWHKQSSDWIKPIDLKTVLTPGVEKTITILGSEAPEPSKSYYSFWNRYVGVQDAQLEQIERFDFFHVTDTRGNTGSNKPKFGNEYPWGNVFVEGGIFGGVAGSGEGEELGPLPLLRVADACDNINIDPGNSPIPSGGLLIVHNVVGAENQGEPEQQSDPSKPTYLVVQADGKEDLQAPLAGSGNAGDNGDLFPGACQTTQWNALSSPSNRWREIDAGVNGLEIVDIQAYAPGSLGFGSSDVTFLWTPQDSSSLNFIDVASTLSLPGNIFPLKYRVFDVYGDTQISFYMDDNNQGYQGELIDDDTELGPVTAEFNPFIKGDVLSPGDVTDTGGFRIDMSGYTGKLYFYALLNPENCAIDPAVGLEYCVSEVRAAFENAGNGTLDISEIIIDESDYNSSTRVESWTVTNVGNSRWTVCGSVSGLQTVDNSFVPCEQADDYTGQKHLATTNVDYHTKNPTDAIIFKITPGSSAFQVGDRFFFTTTGWTRYSEGIDVDAGEVGPHPQANFLVRVDGQPGTVAFRDEVFTFDASVSVDPGNIPFSNYSWDFGDGTTLAGANRVVVTHSYSLPGTYEVTLTVRNEQLQEGTVTKTVTVLSNKPRIRLTSDPSPLRGGLPFTGEVQAEIDDLDGGNIVKVELDRQYACDGSEAFTANATKTFNDALVETEFPISYSSDYNGCVAIRATDDQDDTSIATLQVIAGNQPPLAIIRVGERVTTESDVLTWRALEPLELSADESMDPDDDPLTYAWFFTAAALADGIPDATSIETTAQYSVAKEHKITLLVSDGHNVSSATLTVNIVLTSDNEISASIAATPATGKSPLQVRFNAVAQNDLDEDMTYTWRFGDGSPTQQGNPPQGIKHSYVNETEDPVVFTVELTVVATPSGVSTKVSRQIEVLPGEEDDVPNPDDPTLETYFNIVRVLGGQVDGDVVEGKEPLTVVFTTAGSRALDGSRVTMDVRFGDGERMTTAAGVEIGHTYREGIYEATATTVAEDGRKNTSDPFIIRVDSANAPNVVLDVDPLTGPAALTVSFDASDSTDPQDLPMSFSWNFGDNGNNVFVEGDDVVTHTYTQPGTYVATVRVTNSQGESAQRSATITVTQGGGQSNSNINDNTILPSLNENGGEQVEPPGTCGLGCGATGAAQLLLMLLGMVGLKAGRRRHG